MVKLDITLLAIDKILVMFNHDIFCPLDFSFDLNKTKEILQGKRLDSLSTNDFLIENEAGEIRWYSSIANKSRDSNKTKLSDNCSNQNIEPILLKPNEEFKLTEDFFIDDLKINPTDSNIRFHFILSINFDNFIITSNWVKI